MAETFMFLSYKKKKKEEEKSHRTQKFQNQNLET